MMLHFDIGREKSINALEKAMVTDQHIFLASQKDDNTDLPTPDDFYHIGTVAKIKQMLKLPGDSIRVLVESLCRGRIDRGAVRSAVFQVQDRGDRRDRLSAGRSRSGGAHENGCWVISTNT